ncbi:hypothetical protein EMCRGX_G003557 [Ephydatia muelleri]
MAVTVSDRLLTVGRGRDREGLMLAIAGRDRDRQGSNSGTLVDETNITPREVVKGGSLEQGTAVDGEFDLDLIIITEVAGLSAGAAALSTEERKHTENDPKCNALGWCCVPLVTESYGAWGKEAMDSF